MSRQPTFRPRARADLSAIWDYTADRWGLDQADRYVAGLRYVAGFRDACDALARGDRLGQDASALRPGYRKLRSGRHVIFYRVRPDGVEIVRILHERMDTDRRL